MPTITVSYKDLQDLIGKHIRVKELGNLLHGYCKIELDSHDEKSDELTLSVADTNMPFLWSAEGIARRLRGALGIDNGEEILVLAKDSDKSDKSNKSSNYSVIVNSSVDEVRPFISCFVAKLRKGTISEHLLKQLIQLQEKVCEGYGRRRKKVSVGLYPCAKIKFPVYYKAVLPESVSFIPLDFVQEMTLKEILEAHPKGKEYAPILEAHDKYPILIDSDDNILSFAPIINSERTGKVSEEDSTLFFDATGTDETALRIVTNIFAYALHDRGFDIVPVRMQFSKKSCITPDLTRESIKIKKDDINAWLDLDLHESEVALLLNKAGYDFNNWTAIIPSYRGDIMHSVDVIEDIAMMYGYENIKPLALTTLTRGKSLPIVPLLNKSRELVVGLGFQEVMNLMLTNKKILYEKMAIADFGTVEIAQPMSETHSVVRSWLTPLLMSILEKNKHASYPQRIFEQGLVTARKGDVIHDYERLAILSCHHTANFTEIKQILDYLFKSLSIEYILQEVEHGSFIPGRVGRIVIKSSGENNKNSQSSKEIKVGFIGEIHPAVLKNFELDLPVVTLELNLSEIFEVVKK